MNTMSPNCSPSALPKGSGLRTVNNLPVYLMGAVVVGFLLIMTLVMKDRAASQNHQEDAPPPVANSATSFAQEVAGTKTGGLIVPPAPKPKGDDRKKEDRPNLDRDRAADTNKPAAAPAPPPVDEELMRIHQVKAQMFQEALRSKTTVRGAAARSSGSPAPTTAANNMQERLEEVRRMMAANQSNDPTAAYKARLEQLRAAGLAGGAPAPAAGGNGARQGGAPADRWELGQEVQAPRSPYELRAGAVIPATLISGINSDLPGQIVGQVSQHVYDTATGKHLLIPQGSRLVGTYNSGVAYGQERVLVAWTRIVFPDGKALDIGSMPGADGGGYAGFEDQVNHHYVRLFASAILMSAVTAGVTYSQRQSDGGDSDRTDASSVLSEALGQQLGQATAQLLAKNLSIAPTIEIRPGYRFNVIVTKDLTFSKPYQSFDY